MPTREAVERVLGKYGAISGSFISNCNCNQHSEHHPCPELTNALLSLYPSPSREELERILNRMEGWNPKWTKSDTDFLMSWAKGEPRRESWCDHFYHKYGRWCFEWDHSVVPSDWTCCPICKEPRPQEC